MNIIFDFNRTIYDPETRELVPGALALLDECVRKGFSIHLVSRLEPGRDDVLEKIGIAHFFHSVQFVLHKDAAIKNIRDAVHGPMYLIGDHLHDEIRIGNRLGIRTVWLKRGRFSDLTPEGDDDIPWRTVEGLGEISSLIS